MKNAEIFISHSNEEAEFAFELQTMFRNHGLQAWSFEINLPWSAEIAETVRQEINQCDHFVLILSDAACQSAWVQQELGLAVQLRTEREEECPTILGVMCDSPCTSMQVQPRDFDTHMIFGSPYDFTRIRNFNLSSRTATDEIGELTQELKPTVDFITHTDPSEPEGELLQKSFKVYESLFPEEERSPPMDIETWIDESRLQANSGGSIREIYGVLHIRQIPLGMAYLTAYLDHHWTFGNYFGVRAGRRGLRRAEFFLDRIQDEFHEEHMDPEMKGIFFEVEPIDQELLSAVVERGRICGFPDEHNVLQQIRKLRRLNLYQAKGCVVLLRGDNQQPLPYWQPSMRKAFDPEGELPLILMAYLFEGTDKANINLSEILDFVYDSLYGDAYGGLGEVELEGYRPYVQTIRDKVEAAAATYGWKLDKMSIKRQLSKLKYMAHEEGISDSIDL